MPIQYAQRHIQLRRTGNILDNATSYQQWREAAILYDKISGNEIWKGHDVSPLFDNVEVRIRHDKIRSLIDSGNHHELLYTLNEGIHGNMGGIGRAPLYNHCKLGTKHLIDDYVRVIVEALNLIADSPEKDIPLVEKIDFFRRASHCYGRSALMLSGGAGVIYYHHGVVQTLIEQDLLPNVISGASAGSWVCAQLGTLSNEELKQDYFLNKRYNVPSHLNPIKVLSGLDKEVTPSLVKEVAMDGFTNDMTFQEAYEKTGRYINISIAPAEKHQSSRLLNAITSPNVYIRSAIDASSSIPGVIPSVTLYAKDANGRSKPYLPSRKWVDGSFAQDLPAKRLARLFGVNHNIVSLINPIATPFVYDSKVSSRTVRDAITSSAIGTTKHALMSVEKNASLLGANFMSPAILFAHAMLDQDYTGDINLLLAKKDFKWKNVLFKYDQDDRENLILAGQRNTWPKVEMIRNSTMIALTMDKILKKMDAKEFNELDNSKKQVTHLI